MRDDDGAAGWSLAIGPLDVAPVRAVLRVVVHPASSRGSVVRSTLYLDDAGHEARSSALIGEQLQGSAAIDIGGETREMQVVVREDDLTQTSFDVTTPHGSGHGLPTETIVNEALAAAPYRVEVVPDLSSAAWVMA